MNIELQNILMPNNAYKITDVINGQGKEGIPLSALKPGDSFMAKVLDVKYGEVILELIKGSSISARVTKGNDLNIGDLVKFTVKNTGESIALEIVGKETATDKSIMELLKSNGFAVTEENANIVKALIKEGLPIDSESLSKAMFFYHNTPKDKLNSMLFLMKEQLPDIEQTLKLLQKITSGEMVLKDEIVNLFKGEKLTEKDALTILKALNSDKNFTPIDKDFILKSNDIEEKLKTIIKDRLSLPDIRQDLKEETVKFYKDINRLLSKLSEDGTLPKEIIKNIHIIKEDVKFIENINNDKLYVQIPFTTGKHENNCELIVLKGSRKQKKGNISAYINLDTAYLGYVGIYVLKEDNSVTLDFYTDSKHTEVLVENNKKIIMDSLKQKGYNVVGVFLKEYKNKFSLTDNPAKEGEKVRYSFDVRA